MPHQQENRHSKNTESKFSGPSEHYYIWYLLQVQVIKLTSAIIHQKQAAYIHTYLAH